MTREMRVAVIGAGSWGTTLAALTCRKVPAVIWARRPEVAEQINAEHRNEDNRYGEDLPAELRATADLEEAAGHADVVVMAVPSHGFRAVLEEVAPFVRPWIPVVSVTKGLEPGTRARMTEIIDAVSPGIRPAF